MLNTDYKAVIFDMDGVIFDSEKIWQRYDAEADGIFGTKFGPDVRGMFCGMDENRIRQTLKSLRPTLDVDAYREYIKSHVHGYEAEHGAELKPGIIELIETLNEKGIKTALATSSRRERAEALFVKAGLRIEKLFSAAVYREDVKVAKPDPDIFLTAANRLNVAPADTVVIEDSINGLTAAYAGGFVPIMAVDLLAPPQKFLAPPYSLPVAYDIHELKALLGI